MRVFITGASGFIGRAVVKELFDAGHDIPGQRLDLPVKSIPADRAPVFFGWLARLVSHEMTATSESTRRELGWRPVHAGLIADLEHGQF